MDMVGSISMLKNNYYWRTKYFKLQWDYVQTEIAWHNFSGEKFSIWPFPGEKRVVAGEQKDAKLIPVLVYHGVISDPTWQPDEVNVDKKDFQNQMFALKKDGWQSLKMADYLAFIQGKEQLPEKSFLLTFDDGRNDSFYNADPILRAVDYSAVMFVITGRSLTKDSLKQSFHLTTDELQKMAKGGHWEIGSHTQNGHGDEVVGAGGEKNHFMSNLAWLPDQKRLETEIEYRKRITDDLMGSKKDIESLLGTKDLSFAYPYGDRGQTSSNLGMARDLLAEITEKIFPISFVQSGNNDFISNPANNSPVSKRIGVDSMISAFDLVAMLNNSRYKELDYTDDFSRDNGWLRGWGGLTMANGEMEIGTTQSEDSASTFLSGSSLWKNYLLSAKIHILKGNSFELVARYNDENGNVSCVFSGEEAFLNQKTNGQENQSLGSVLLPDPVSVGKNMQVAIGVKDSVATCYLDGTAILKGEIDSSVEQGGVGFKTWDSLGTGSLFSVADLTVTAN